jgi:hypothetical protein
MCCDRQGLRRGYEVSGDESRWSCLSPSGRDVSARRNLPATRAGNTSFRGGGLVMGAPRFICGGTSIYGSLVTVINFSSL